MVKKNISNTRICINICIHIYIYIHTHVYTYRRLGVVSDRIAQLSAPPYKREKLLLLLLRRRRLLLIIITMGDARGRVKVVANPGFGDRLRACVVRVSVRPSVARGA